MAKEFIKIDSADSADVKQGKELMNKAFEALDADTQKSLETYQKAAKEQNDAIMQKSTELEKQLTEYKAAAEAAGKTQTEQIEELKNSLLDLNKAKVNDEGKRKKSFSESIYETLEGKEAEFKSYLANKKAGMSFAMKAAPTTMLVAANAVAPQFANIVGPGHEIAHARNFIPVSPTVSNLIRYVQFTGTGNIINTVAPATTKPQIDYTETVVDAPVVKIAGWINVADEFLEDIVGATDFLSAELPMALYDVEDQQIFKGAGTTGNLNGLYTQASALTFPYATVTSGSNDIDKLAAAATFVRRRKRVVTAAWTSPEDYLAILINKASGSGEYTYPVRFNDNSNLLMIGDMPVLQHTVFNPGEGFVGDFARGARIFQRADATLRFSTENATNFVQNITTVLIEERIALADFFPESFVKVTLNATFS